MYLLLHDANLGWQLELETAVMRFQVSGMEPFEMTKVSNLLSDNTLGRVRKGNMISQTRKAAIGIFEVTLRTESLRSAPGVH
jgi:hypothetical protein